MKAFLCAIISLFVLCLTGCNKPPEPKFKHKGHTVTWFMKHDEVLKQTLKLCSDDPAKYNKEPDCINALHAANQLSAGELHPIDW
ncbi:hypothetical protein D5018_17700 [Parashewanella curva]|uniref:EexN family lipoprotein n=1 Tax=Parashewanella curva TaxID=2338552 RepID=A0A3L8PUY0_9GAMM|nr:EexN family lipoprotein [Parashewanella curva]RLV58383.1 hypothetical protein D5018_17700 [Parashewanella curva]